MMNAGQGKVDVGAASSSMLCLFCSRDCSQGICDLCHRAKLEQAAQLRPAFLAGDPYPHVVVDGFFSEEVLEGVLRRFPKVSDEARVPDLKHQPGKHAWDLQGKKKAGDLKDTEIIQLLDALTSDRMVEIVEALTGVRNLEADPTYYGGGLHQLVPGGHLDIHTDFRRMHAGSPKYRRLNMLIYLNRDWKAEYGAAFEMWNDPPTACVKSVLPEFNRMVVFATTGTSWHGHPHPMTCPPDRTRKSIALYFYSNEPGDQDLKDLPVQWLGRGPKRIYNAVRSTMNRALRRLGL